MRRGRGIWKNVNNSGGIQHIGIYAIIVIMAVGVCVGAVAANLMSGASNESVKSYITGFLGAFDRTAINTRASFFDSLYKYARIIVVIWVSGLFAPGVVIVVCVLLFKAFAYGFTTAALVKYFGFYGLVVGFSSYIPQNIFFLPAMVLVSYNAAIAPRLRGGSRAKGLKQNDSGITEYIIVFITGFLCCAVAALIEAFITPTLIEYIMPV